MNRLKEEAKHFSKQGLLKKAKKALEHILKPIWDTNSIPKMHYSNQFQNHIHELLMIKQEEKSSSLFYDELPSVNNICHELTQTSPEQLAFEFFKEIDADILLKVIKEELLNNETLYGIVAVESNIWDLRRVPCVLRLLYVYFWINIILLQRKVKIATKKIVTQNVYSNYLKNIPQISKRPPPYLYN